VTVRVADLHRALDQVLHKGDGEPVMLVETAYDRQADALYMRLREGEVVRTDEIDDLDLR
jgi:hypothetical protein